MVHLSGTNENWRKRYKQRRIVLDIMINFSSWKEYSPAFLRIGMGLVFLWFGSNQLINPEDWIGYLPSFLLGVARPELFMYGNGTLEVVLGVCLVAGLFVRLSAVILALHLIGIISSLGYNAVAVRDFGLMMATIVVALNGSDQFCLSEKMKKKN